MKTIIKYIFIHRILLIVITLYCLTLLSNIKTQSFQGDYNFKIFQGDHIYYYKEPKPILLHMWSIWDSKWYISIAEDGYSKQKYPFERIDNKGFMPLYPILIWFLSTILFINSHLSGILLSNIFLILSLFFIKKLIESDENLKNKIKITDVYLYILFFPTSYFLSSVYPESLFLFLSILFFYFINTKKILSACIITGLAFITKIYGVFLLIPLIIYIFKNKNTINILELIKYIIFTSIIPIIYLLYMYKISNTPFAYMDIQRQFFDHEWVNPIIPIIRGFIDGHFHTILNSTFTFISIILLFIGFKFIHYSYIIYGLLIMIFTPFTGIIIGNARYSAGLFVIPLLLAILIKKDDTKLFVLSSMAFVQGFLLIWWIIGLIS